MTEDKQTNMPLVLLILDGWGVAAPNPGNAITSASTPTFDNLTKSYFTAVLHAAGEAVGLKWGEMGNSEVGHLAIGAGRTVFQIQQRIDQAIIDGSFFENAALMAAVKHVKQHNSSLHLVGLLSDSGVHASVEHLYALLELAEQQKISKLFIHPILDGRDATYNSGHRYMQRLLVKIKAIGLGQVASLAGRFWAMDRDNHWDRIGTAYKAMTGAGQLAADPLQAIEAAYTQNIFDEQFKPVSLTNQGRLVGQVSKNDAVIFFNFRPDRARQLTRAFVNDNFSYFERQKIENLFFATMAQYSEGLPVTVAFPPQLVTQSLAEVMAEQKLRQLHVAETEKYAHVTYFFNGGREKPHGGEDRVLVPSLGVASYESHPEMSAAEIREQVVNNLGQDKYDFYIVNFANADMVGHTGNLAATIAAVEVIDKSISQIWRAVTDKAGTLVITADHGNAEEVLNLNTGQINKEHSARPVPFILANPAYEIKSGTDFTPDLSQITPGGFLSDVAPTILKVMALPQPQEMTGRPLI